MVSRNCVGDTSSVGERELERVRGIALALPGVVERRSHGALCFFIQGKRPLCYYHDHHRGDGRISLWCPAPPGVQEELVTAEPGRFFKPEPSAGGTFADWLGIHLDTSGDDQVDWSEVAAIIADTFRSLAPKNLVARLDDDSGLAGE